MWILMFLKEIQSFCDTQIESFLMSLRRIIELVVELHFKLSIKKQTVNIPAGMIKQH